MNRRNSSDMNSIRASVVVREKILFTNGLIPLLKSPQSGNAYDLVYSLQQLYKSKYKFGAIEMEKRWRDFNYPNARPDTLRVRLTDKPKKSDFLTDADVRKLDTEMKDVAYRLSVTITLLVDEAVTMKSGVFDFHRCLTCEEKADFFDKLHMEAFCCGMCHNLYISALPTNVTTSLPSTPPNEEDFWEGPFGVWVPRTINDVPARDGRNRRSQNGDGTRRLESPLLSEAEWKAKYAHEKEGYWFFRV